MKKSLYVMVFFLAIGLIGCSGSTEEGNVSEIIETQNTSKTMEATIISDLESGKNLRSTLGLATEEDIQYLSGSEIFAAKINEKIAGMIENSEYQEMLILLESLEEFQLENEMIRNCFDEQINPKLSSMEDKEIINMAYHLQKSYYFESDYYLTNYYEIVREKLSAIIETSEIPISSKELRRKNYTLESDRATISYYGDFNVWLYESTKTTTNISTENKLVIKLISVDCDSVGAYCKGSITNNTEDTYKYLQIKASFTNSLGEVVDIGSTYAVGSEGLEPGEKVGFTIYGNGEISSVSGCKLRPIGITGYVLDSDIVTSTEKITREEVYFHHTALDEENIEKAAEAYHYVDGYLIVLKEDLQIIPVDEQTKAEMEDLATWTEEDHLLARVEYEAMVGDTLYDGLIAAYQILPEGFPNKEAIIETMKKIMRYDGEYTIIYQSDDTTKLYTPIELNGRVGADGNYYMEISKGYDFIDGYYKADDYVRYGLYQLGISEDGDYIFSAYYCGGSYERWLLKDGKIYIFNVRPYEGLTDECRGIGSKTWDIYGEEVFTTDYSVDIPYECFEEDPSLPKPEVVLEETTLVDKEREESWVTYFYETIGSPEECVNSIRQYCELVKKNGRHYVFDEASDLAEEYGWEDYYYLTNIMRYDDFLWQHTVEGLEWKDNTLRWSIEMRLRD